MRKGAEIQIRVSEEDKLLFRAAAEACGKNLSEWLVDLARDGSRPRLPFGGFQNSTFSDVDQSVADLVKAIGPQAKQMPDVAAEKRQVRRGMARVAKAEVAKQVAAAVEKRGVVEGKPAIEGHLVNCGCLAFRVKRNRSKL